MVKNNKNVLVLFYASWCPFSQTFLPVFEKHAASGDCYRVLTDEASGCEEEYSIEIVPTVLFFQSGKLARRLDGAQGEGLNENQIKEMTASCGIQKRTERDGRHAKRRSHTPPAQTLW